MIVFVEVKLAYAAHIRCSPKGVVVRFDNLHNVVASQRVGVTLYMLKHLEGFFYRVEDGKPLIGAYPDVLQMVYKYRAHIVARQAVGVFRIVSEVSAALGMGVVYYHTLHSQTYIQVSLAIISYASHASVKGMQKPTVDMPVLLGCGIVVVHTAVIFGKPDSRVGCHADVHNGVHHLAACLERREGLRLAVEYICSSVF